MFPSTSRKRAETLPHTGVASPSSRGAAGTGVYAGSYLIRRSRGELANRTPLRVHSWNRPATSDVTSTTCVARPMSLCSGDPGAGATRVRIAVPSGGDTATQRSPFWRRVSIASRKPSLST